MGFFYAVVELMFFWGDYWGIYISLPDMETWHISYLPEDSKNFITFVQNVSNKYSMAEIVLISLSILPPSFSCMGSV